MKRALCIAFIVASAVLSKVVNSCAQTVVLQDPNFKQCIMDQCPACLDASGDLIISAANGRQGGLDCSARGIRNIQGIEYFKNIWDLNFSNNAIEVVPSLAAYANTLRTFEIDNNRLTQFPVFAANATLLKKVNIANNNIDSLPDLTNIPNVDTFRCTSNYFVNDDLLKILHQINPYTFDYAFQKIHVNVAELEEGESHIFHFPGNDTVSNFTCILKFPNGGQFNATSSVRTFTMDSMSHRHAGTYQWYYSTPALPGFTGRANEIILIKNKNSGVFTPNGDGMQDEFYISPEGTTNIYTKDGKLVKEIIGPCYWDGTDKAGKLLAPGAYILRCDEEEMVVTLIY